VDRIVGARYGAEVGRWAGLAGQCFSQQLVDNAAQPHRFMTDRFAGALGYSEAESDALGEVLDTLQVSFDLADNLADREADRARGCNYLGACENVPLAVLTYLPAVLAASAIDLVYTAFRSEKFTPAAAVAKLGKVIGEMVRGQAEPSGSPRRVDLLSGKQGLLLCLPFWLREGATDLPCPTLYFEQWAYQFGCTWELNQVHRDGGSPESRAAWTNAMLETRLSWPRFGPFGPGGPLQAQALFPACVL
jgi:hypothetical protein